MITLDSLDMLDAAREAGMPGARWETLDGDTIGAILHNRVAYVFSGETFTVARTTAADWQAYRTDHAAYVDATGCESWTWLDDVNVDVAAVLDYGNVDTLADAITALAE